MPSVWLVFEKSEKHWEWSHTQVLGVYSSEEDAKRCQAEAEGQVPEWAEERHIDYDHWIEEFEVDEQ